MDKLFDIYIDLKLRLFYVLAMTACIANTLGYISNALLYGMTMATFFPFCCALVIYAASIYGVRTGHTKIPVLLILCICDIVEFPVLYCIYGAYRLPYMMLGIVATVLFLEGTRRIVFGGLLVVYNCLFIVWRAADPEFFVTFMQHDSWISVLITLLIACSSIVAMMSILLRQHDEQRKRMEHMTEELQKMVHLDPLTQLYNRRYLTQFLERKIANGELDFAVVLLDIDNFKYINDTYGHVYGDEVLQAFAKILMRHIKGRGIVTRFGGEEFMLVFHSARKDGMQKVLDQCASDFKQYGMSTKGMPITFSGGVAAFHDEDMLVKLFNAADERLYEAKHTGKKHVVYE